MTPDAPLVLIRHAATRPDPALPAREWTLAPNAAEACRTLADRLASRPGLRLPPRLYTSDEPKARLTGRHLADRLGLAVLTATGLHEHDRRGVPFLGERRWQETLERFFALPDQRVFGRESAAEALARVERALDALRARHPGEPLWVVGHGTVFTLYVAKRHEAGRSPADTMAFWRSLAMPEALLFGDAGLEARISALTD